MTAQREIFNTSVEKWKMADYRHVDDRYNYGHISVKCDQIILMKFCKPTLAKILLPKLEKKLTDTLLYKKA